MPKGEFETMSMPRSRKVGTLGQFLVRAAPSHQQSELTGVDELRPAARIRNRMDVTTEQRVHHLGVALERDVRPFDPLPFGNLLHRDVEAGAGARRAIVDLAGVGLGVGEELLERLPRRIGSHHDTECVTADADDVGEVRARIESRLSHEGKAEDGDRDLRDRVAIGLCGRGHLARGERAGATRPILDDDRLPEMLFGRGRERAHADVGGAAGGPGHDEGDGPHGKILRRRGADPCGQSSRERAAKDDAFHGVSLLTNRYSAIGPKMTRKTTSDHFLPQSRGKSCVCAPTRR